MAGSPQPPTAVDPPRAPEPTRTKRKRNTASYVAEDYFDELDIEELEDAEISSDEEVAFGSKARPKKKAKKPKAKKPKKLKKGEYFRFLDLPAELRDEIYDLALTEPSGLTLTSKVVSNRRTVTRGTITTEDGNYYYGKQQRRYRWYNRHAGRNKQVLGEPTRELIPNLLAVNKQISGEASSVLYKQEIVFDDMAALYIFVNQIGPVNRLLLNELTIKGWSTNAVQNYATFVSLAGCTNLQSLFIDCTLGWHRRPGALAKQIYRDGHIFLEEFGRANGSYDAGVDVLEFSSWHFDSNREDRSYGRYRGRNVDEIVHDDKKENEFRNRLRRLLKD